MDKSEIPQETRVFIEGLLADSGMDALDDPVKEEMIKELYARLDSYLATVVADNLKEDDIDTFVKLNEEKKPKEEIEKFLKDKIPNVKDVFATAFADFRSFYLSGVASRRQGQSEKQEEGKIN